MSKLESASIPADPVALFAALGDATRLSLVMRLGDGVARSITALTVDVGMTRQAITKHLRVLEAAGLVAHVRAGRESRFVGRPEPIAAARAYLDRIAAQWEDALERLRAFVET